MRRNLKNAVVAIMLALPLIMLTGYSDVHADGKHPCSKGAAGHAKTAVKHLKEAIEHLEQAEKAGGNEHVKQALEHANEALTHAKEGAK